MADGDQKPSERIEAEARRSTALLMAPVREKAEESKGRAYTDEEWAALAGAGSPYERHEAHILMAMISNAIVNEMDREALRRAQWEKEVMAELRGGR